MRKIIFAIGAVLLLISICNIPVVRWLFGTNDCQFSNGDGSFTFAEVTFKGADYGLCQENFAEFKKRKLGDTILYRISPMNFLHFWEYGEYILSKKYRVPYKPWPVIEARRGPLGNRSGFQDF
jgi:hypothetical protein